MLLFFYVGMELEYMHIYFSEKCKIKNTKNMVACHVTTLEQAGGASTIQEKLLSLVSKTKASE